VPAFTAEGYQIEAALDANLRLKATIRISAKIRDKAAKALPFEVARAIEITGARIDGVPAELLFRESDRARELRTDENDAFLLIAPEALAPGSAHEIEFEEAGSVISTAGKDVYFVRARSNWYPRGGTDLSVYDLAFRYPKHLTLVTPGDLVEDRTDSEWRYTRRRTPVPIRIAGFNLGDYARVQSPAQGFRVEVYGNRSLEASLVPKPVEQAPEPQASAAVPLVGRGGRRPPPLPVPLPPAPPDPLARLRTVAADVSSAVQIFSNWFGPPVISSLTVAPIPGTFGQGFPGLVYLSTLAYLDPSERPAQVRSSHDRVFFSDLLQAHEVAHQWWGNLLLPAGYQDEWLSEALANYSALMYWEKKSGTKAMQEVLLQYREMLLRKKSDGETVESVGPITLGFRLESPDSPSAWNTITYDKGAWIFHMLRRRLGDERFLKLLAELRKRYEGRRVSTADVRTVSKEFLPPKVRPSVIDAFFDNWIYSTGIPALKLSYTVKGVAPNIKLSGKIDQSGVDDDFSIEAPVEVQFAKGTPQTFWVETTNSGATFSATLKQIPSKVSIPIGTDVLATKK
jgi:aminopeptidase N